MRARALGLLGWFVDWEPGIPFDADTRHCTYWMWRHRLAGWFVCPIRGHGEWRSDHCGLPAHDQCGRCAAERGEGVHGE